MIKQKIRRLIGKPLQMLGYTTGLMKLTSRMQKNEGAVILMYHSVAGSDHAKWIDPQNHVPSEIFDRQMEYLSKHRNVISLDDLIEMIENGETPSSGTVVLTFDDGYLDNLTVAAPILDKYGLSATLFLPTGYIDRGETQWIDKVYAIFKFRTQQSLDWENGQKRRFFLNKKRQCQQAYKAVCNKLMISGIEKRKEILNNLDKQLKPTETPPKLTMDWSEIRKLQNQFSCFKFGGHTLEHTDLTGVHEKTALEEMQSCAEVIKEKIQEPVNHFSFCYGRSSEKLRELAGKAGYKSACSADGLEIIINKKTNIFQLQRVESPNTLKRFNILTSSLNTGFWRKIGQ